MKRVLLAVLCCLLAFSGACASETVQGTSTPVATPSKPVAASTPSPSSTATKTPQATATPEKSTKATVMIAGDLMCLGAQLAAAKSGSKYSFDYSFAKIKSTISSADLAIGNLETMVAEGYPYTAISSGAGKDDYAQPGPTENGRPITGGPLLNAPESYLKTVVNCGFDVFTLANNHSYDCGADGIAKTLKKIDGYKIPHTGMYAKAEDKAPLIVTVKGIRIGIVAYTDILNISLGKNSAMLDIYDEDKVEKDIAAVKKAGADITMFFIHWGIENTHDVDSSQKKIAKAAAEAGADLILGSHPHCTQTIDLIKTDHGDVPVIYSMGNFVSSMARTINNDSVIVKLGLEKTGDKTSVASFTYIPILCRTTDAGRFVVLPADQKSIKGDYASALKESRERTIEVLGETIAKPE